MPFSRSGNESSGPHILRESQSKKKKDGDVRGENFCNFRFQIKTGKTKTKCDYIHSVFLPYFCFSFSRSLSSLRLMSLVKGNGLRDSKVLDHLVCSQAKELPQCHYALMAAQTRISDKQLSLMHSLTDASSLSSPYRGLTEAPFSQKKINQTTVEVHFAIAN